MGSLSDNRDSTEKKEDNSARIELLNRQIINILNALAEVERDERGLLSKKSDMIKALAETFEKLHGEGAYTQPVNTICSFICRLVRERGLLASERWIHEVVDSRFKQIEFSPVSNQTTTTTTAATGTATYSTEGDTTNATTTPPSIEEEDDDNTTIPQILPDELDAWRYLVENSLRTPETSSQVTDPYYQKIVQKPIDEMNPEELRAVTEQKLKEAKHLKDMSREASRQAEFCLERCDEKKIAVDPEVRGIEQIPTESATSDESGPSEFSKALKEYSNVIYRAHQKVEKYKPPVHLDKRFAKAIQEMILVWRPWVDEKFRKDSFSWLHVAMDECAHGKHAAATIHSTVLPDGTKRALTREQVGDKKEMINQQAMRILSVWKDLVSMHRWNYELQEKAIALRAKKLHRRLSNSA